MTKGTTIFLLGLLLILLPYLGIPLWWKQIMSIVTGILLLGIGYALRRSQFLATLDTESGTRMSETFVETTEPLFDTTR